MPTAQGSADAHPPVATEVPLRQARIEEEQDSKKDDDDDEDECRASFQIALTAAQANCM